MGARKQIHLGSRPQRREPCGENTPVWQPGGPQLASMLARAALRPLYAVRWRRVQFLAKKIRLRKIVLTHFRLSDSGCRASDDDAVPTAPDANILPAAPSEQGAAREEASPIRQASGPSGYRRAHRRRRIAEQLRLGIAGKSPLATRLHRHQWFRQSAIPTIVPNTRSKQQEQL